LSANPVGMRAGFATLSRVDEQDGWRTLNARTAAFCDELRADLSRAKLDVHVISHGSIFWMHPATASPVRRVDASPAQQGAWSRKVFHAALDRGVYLPPSGFEVCFLSMAHDPETLARARSVIVQSIEEAARG